MYGRSVIKIKIILLLLSVFIISEAQKAELMIVKHSADLETGLQVQNSNFEIIYDESLIPFEDTLFLRVDYDKRFFLNIQNFQTRKDTLPLISLYLNKVPLIIIHSDMESGDHSFPFYSGVGKPQLRIVGGNTASIRDYPWQVFVRSGDYLCGGTIIADKWILTAAHCLFDDQEIKIPDDEISFLVGIERPFEGFSDGVRYDITYSVIHEDYNPSNFENDLALLRTREVIEDEYGKPINIITEEDVSAGATDPGVIATITGWGITNVEPLEFPDNLQSLEIPIVTQNVAEAVWGPLPDNMLMAGYPNERGDACSGDSGGPLIVRVGNEFKIAGVTSWGSSQCNSVGGYVRLSEFTEWLSKNTGVGQGQYRTVRPVGSAFRCQSDDIEPAIRTYISDTLSNAISYDWKIEPLEAGILFTNGVSADVAWSSDFSGEAYVSARALTPDGYTNYAGQRVVIGKITDIKSLSPDTSVCYNTFLLLGVDALGSDLVYNWYKNGNLLISGTEPNIFINALEEPDAGIYQVEVSGSCGTVLSEEIEVTAIPLTEIITYPEDQVIYSGSFFTLDVEVAGDNLEYTWSKEGELLKKSDESSFVFENVDANVTGVYSVRIDGTCGSKVSPGIYLYVDPEIQDFPDGVNIWPTLTRDIINVAIDNDEIFDVYIYNSSGIYLGRQEKQRYQTRINLGNFAPDVYFVEIRLSGESKIYRVVRIN